MILIDTKSNGYNVTVFEALENKNIFGRSVYSIRIEYHLGGVYIVDTGDSLEECIKYYNAYLGKIIKGEKIFTDM